MIILLFKYIYQFIFSIFEKEISSLNEIITSKDSTIARLNKTTSNLKNKIKILNTNNETVNTHETSILPNKYHSCHSKNQKKCKCCNMHFNIEKSKKDTHNDIYCPYCKKKTFT